MSRLTKKDVVTIVREKTGFKRKEVSEIIDETLNSIVENAKRYDEVNLPPLGKFMVKKTKDRNGINPNTKETVVIKGRNVVKFKPTTTFKEEVKE